MDHFADNNEQIPDLPINVFSHIFVMSDNCFLQLKTKMTQTKSARNHAKLIKHYNSYA